MGDQFVPQSVLFNISLTNPRVYGLNPPAYTVLGVCGSIARAASKYPGASAGLTEIQLAPPSVLLNIPAACDPKGPRIPAYSVLESCASIARDTGTAVTIESGAFALAGRPEFAELQLTPPFVVLNTPALVAAYIAAGFCGSTAEDCIAVADNPEFTALQVFARSVLLNTPRPLVAA
jgi:hypothetical protein